MEQIPPGREAALAFRSALSRFGEEEVEFARNANPPNLWASSIIFETAAISPAKALLIITSTMASIFGSVLTRPAIRILTGL